MITSSTQSPAAHSTLELTMYLTMFAQLGFASTLTVPPATAPVAEPAATAPSTVTEEPVAKAAPAPAAKGVVKPAKRTSSSTGLFAPLVKGTKSVMGEKELNKLRGEVIAKHSSVISAFVDTSESKFGQLVLKRMFEAADKDGNGTLDKEEVRDALEALGFDFLGDKQVSGILARADGDDNEVIDFEEVCAL